MQPDSSPSDSNLHKQLRSAKWSERRDAYTELAHTIISHPSPDTYLSFLNNLVDEKHPSVLHEGLTCVHAFLTHQPAFRKHLIKLVNEGLEKFPLMSSTQHRAAVLEQFAQILEMCAVESNVIRAKLSGPQQKVVMYAMEVAVALGMVQLRPKLQDLARTAHKESIRQLAQQLEAQLATIQPPAQIVNIGPKSPRMEVAAKRTATSSKFTNETAKRAVSEKQLATSNPLIQKLPLYDTLSFKEQQAYSTSLLSIMPRCSPTELPPCFFGMLRLMIEDNNYITSTNGLKILMLILKTAPQTLPAGQLPMLVLLGKFQLMTKKPINTLLLQLIDAIVHAGRTQQLVMAIGEGFQAQGAKANLKAGCVRSLGRLMSIFSGDQRINELIDGPEISREHLQTGIPQGRDKALKKVVDIVCRDRKNDELTKRMRSALTGEIVMQEVSNTASKKQLGLIDQGAQSTASLRITEKQGLNTKILASENTLTNNSSTTLKSVSTKHGSLAVSVPSSDKTIDAARIKDGFEHSLSHILKQCSNPQISVNRIVKVISQSSMYINPSCLTQYETVYYADLLDDFVSRYAETSNQQKTGPEVSSFVMHALQVIATLKAKRSGAALLLLRIALGKLALGAQLTTFLQKLTDNYEIQQIFECLLPKGWDRQNNEDDNSQVFIIKKSNRQPLLQWAQNYVLSVDEYNNFQRRVGWKGKAKIQKHSTEGIVRSGQQAVSTKEYKKTNRSTTGSLVKDSPDKDMPSLTLSRLPSFNPSQSINDENVGNSANIQINRQTKAAKEGTTKATLNTVSKAVTNSVKKDGFEANLSTDQIQGRIKSEREPKGDHNQIEIQETKVNTTGLLCSAKKPIINIEEVNPQYESSKSAMPPNEPSSNQLVNKLKKQLQNLKNPLMSSLDRQKYNHQQNSHSQFGNLSKVHQNSLSNYMNNNSPQNSFLDINTQKLSYNHQTPVSACSAIPLKVTPITGRDDKQIGIRQVDSNGRQITSNKEGMNRVHNFIKSPLPSTPFSYKDQQIGGLKRQGGTDQNYNDDDDGQQFALDYTDSVDRGLDDNYDQLNDPYRRNQYQTTSNNTFQRGPSNTFQRRPNNTFQRGPANNSYPQDNFNSYNSILHDQLISPIRSPLIPQLNTQSGYTSSMFGHQLTNVSPQVRVKLGFAHSDNPNYQFNHNNNINNQFDGLKKQSSNQINPKQYQYHKLIDNKGVLQKNHNNYQQSQQQETYVGLTWKMEDQEKNKKAKNSQEGIYKDYRQKYTLNNTNQHYQSKQSQLFKQLSHSTNQQIYRNQSTHNSQTNNYNTKQQSPSVIQNGRSPRQMPPIMPKTNHKNNQVIKQQIKMNSLTNTVHHPLSFASHPSSFNPLPSPFTPLHITPPSTLSNLLSNPPINPFSTLRSSLLIPFKALPLQSKPLYIKQLLQLIPQQLPKPSFTALLQTVILMFGEMMGDKMMVSCMQELYQEVVQRGGSANQLIRELLNAVHKTLQQSISSTRSLLITILSKSIIRMIPQVQDIFEALAQIQQFYLVGETIYSNPPKRLGLLTNIYMCLYIDSLLFISYQYLITL